MFGGSVALSRIGLPVAAADAKDMSVLIGGRPVKSSFDAERSAAVFDTAALDAGGRIEIHIPRLSLRHLPDIKNL